MTMAIDFKKFNKEFPADQMKQQMKEAAENSGFSDSKYFARVVKKYFNFGEENNQKIHSLPFARLYQLLEYKLKNKGIELIYQKEYYTSKCPINTLKVSKEYAGKGRIKRGIYTLDNIVYNADSGGAYNIMKLYAEEKNTPINMVCKGLNNPYKISICVTNS